MKKHIYLLLATVMLLFTGCNGLDQANAYLEQANAYLDHQNDIMNWYHSTNSQLVALQSIVKALEEDDAVKAVTALENGNGYTVFFGKNKPVVIKDIKAVDGEVEAAAITPLIGVALFTDNNYYWTVKIGSANPTWLLDNKGNKIRTNKTKQQEDATLRVLIARYSDDNYYWQINGEWLMVNNAFVPATLTQAEVVFAKDGIDITDDDNVTITLANGTTLQLPKYKFLPFAGATDPITIEEPSLTIPLALPSDFSESHYGSIKAKMTANDPSDPDQETKAEEEPMWEISVNEPTFLDGVYQNDASVTIKPIIGKLTVGDIATLEVSFIDTYDITFTASTDIHVGAIATVDEDTHTLTLITKGSLTEELISQAIGESKTLIINGLLSGEYDDTSKQIDGDWAILRAALQTDDYDQLDVTMNHIITVIGRALSQTKLASIALPQAAHIGTFAFDRCSALTTITLPEVTDIESAAFISCKELTSVSLPKATIIQGRAFMHCFKLASVWLPKATEIGNTAFNECHALTTVYIPKATKIGNSGAFAMCYELTTISLPNATSIGGGAFARCTTLTTVLLPKATEIGIMTFTQCNQLVTITLPEATIIEEFVFDKCPQLTTVTLPKITEIGQEAFSNCESLTTLKLAETGSITYFGTDVFIGTNTENIDLFLGPEEIAAQSVTTGENKVWRGYTWKSIAQY